MNKDLMFSSATCEWATPPELFKALDAEFDFTCDVCATADNAKCKEFYSPEQDGLAQEWTGAAGATRQMAARLAIGYARQRKVAAPS